MDVVVAGPAASSNLVRSLDHRVVIREVVAPVDHVDLVSSSIRHTISGGKQICLARDWVNIKSPF